jgi:PhzF family phenazine biosynthesis protein
MTGGRPGRSDGRGEHILKAYSPKAVLIQTGKIQTGIELMPVPIYVVDAFTTKLFSGNPAAVVLFDAYPEDAILQAIAAENNLAETAYPVRRSDGNWDLRWFTPTVEVPLCGHATLASAYILFNHLIPDATEIIFETRKSGALKVRRDGDLMTMNFPAKMSIPVADDLSHLFGANVVEVRKDSSFIMVVLNSAEAVSEYVFDRDQILSLDRDGVIITAPGDNGYDCVSRFFTPAHGIDEDPVTGGAHCMLIPYWTQRLGKDDLRAYQASARGGELLCKLQHDRVEMSGHCAPYLAGSIEV